MGLSSVTHMATLISPSSILGTPQASGKHAEVSEKGRNALVLRYALALPSSKQRLPKCAGMELAGEFGVSISYARNLWSREQEQLKTGNTVSLKSAARMGRPPDFTPTKHEKIRQMNADNRTLTLEIAREACRASKTKQGREGG